MYEFIKLVKNTEFGKEKFQNLKKCDLDTAQNT